MCSRKKKNWTIHLYNLVFHGLIYISLKRQKGTSLSLSLSLSFPSLTVSFILALFFSSSSVYVLSPCLFVSPPLLATGPALQTSGIRQFRSVLSLACIGPKKTSSPPHLQYLVQFLETYWLTFLIAFFFPWIFQSLHLFHTLTFTCAFSFHPFSKFLPALVIKLFVVLLIFFSSLNTFWANLGKTGQLTSENASLQTEVQSQRELIEQLELDVSSLQNLSTMNRGEAEVCPLILQFYKTTMLSARYRSKCLWTTTGACWGRGARRAHRHPGRIKGVRVW